MTLDQVPPAAHVFVDANILVYHFQPHPGFGLACHRLLERIERQDIEGYTSTNLLGELSHRLMVIEAGALPGWTGGKVLNRLKQQPGLRRCVERYNELDEGFICTIEREELCDILYELGDWCGLDSEEEWVDEWRDW